MFWKGFSSSSILRCIQDWPERSPSCSSLCNIWTAHSLRPCRPLYKVSHSASHCIACCLTGLCSDPSAQKNLPERNFLCRRRSSPERNLLCRRRSSHVTHRSHRTQCLKYRADPVGPAKRRRNVGGTSSVVTMARTWLLIL